LLGGGLFRTRFLDEGRLCSTAPLGLIEELFGGKFN
jgi:hypothetical protein